jgi:RNA polymerase-binding transcription factor DksA
VGVIGMAQRRQAEEVEHALAARGAPKPGRSHCANIECGEPISDLRRDLGAQFCIDCMHVRETEAQRWAPRAGR